VKSPKTSGPSLRAVAIEAAQRVVRFEKRRARTAQRTRNLRARVRRLEAEKARAVELLWGVLDLHAQGHRLEARDQKVARHLRHAERVYARVEKRGKRRDRRVAALVSMLHEARPDVAALVAKYPAAVPVGNLPQDPDKDRQRRRRFVLLRAVGLVVGKGRDVRAAGADALDRLDRWCADPSLLVEHVAATS
jgi:hypothetical protein